MDVRQKAPKDAIFIKELAEMLERKPNSIRLWVGHGKLPKKLMPRRVGGRQQLYWLPSQVDGLKKFAAEMEAKKGWQHAA